jgi:hypothetical protein
VVVEKEMGEIFMEQGNSFKALEIFNDSISSLY